nr:hypothetical protein MACL_00001092 [Theileria orientalis]
MKTAKRPSLKYYNSKNTHCSFLHDVLLFLSYFINNFLFFCYGHIILNTFMAFLSCIYNVYDNKYKFTTKLVELSISYIIVYTWLYRFSSNFDGYAFHHIFYYKYRIINFREMLSRVLGTLGSAALFGWLYHRFSEANNDYKVDLKATLKKMIDSNEPLTIMDSFVYPMLTKSSREGFFKKYASTVMFEPLGNDEKNYELLEKYVAMLVECFVVELTFSVFVYIMSSLVLKIKGCNKSVLAFSSFVRNAFVTSGNTFLKSVDGTITLDETRSLVIFFNQPNVTLLVVRLLANMVGAVMVPLLLPMPKIMSLYDYKDMYPNSKLVKGVSISGMTEPYFVNNTLKKTEVYYTPWPNSIMGKYFLKLETYVNNKIKSK